MTSQQECLFEVVWTKEGLYFPLARNQSTQATEELLVIDN